MTPPRPPRSLSPSRASDFMTCPLLYRYRVIDELPEPPGVEAQRGRLVHAVLEDLFDSPAAQRTPGAAQDLLVPRWQRMAAEDPPMVALLFGPAQNWAAHLNGQPLAPPDPAAEAAFLDGARARLEAYFRVEDPRRIAPAARELYVEAPLAGGLVLRGFIDRLERAADGRTRVVDYKTGRSPSEAFAQKAMFQMKCYALAMWRVDGRIPSMLQLLYLGDEQVLRYEPSEEDLRATERKLVALWGAIERATEADDWRPRTSALCRWCHHRSICPAWAGETTDEPVGITLRS